METCEKRYKKISQMIYSLTQIDVRYHDQAGNTQFQILNNTIPVLLDNHKNDSTHIREKLIKHSTEYYYHYQNSFGFDFIAVGLWDNLNFVGSIVVGPFITSTSILDLIKEIIYKNNLPISQRKQLEDYFQSLPILSESEYQNIGELLVNICNNPFIDAKKIPSSTIKPILNHEQLYLHIEEEKQRIEYRYEEENRLMHAISKGDKKKVQQLLQSFGNLIEFSNRIPESPIRSIKNIAFVSNTLYRLGAERGGVHPVYLHNISERFAIIIERTTTIPALEKLIVLMANEYCDLVRNYGTGKFSPIVKRAVDYIQLNLGNPLGLNKIAEEIHLNPSHLSRKFKEETGVSITEFINQKRVDEAKLYLQQGRRTITDIALMVGFNDLNYFSKVFKRLVGITPSQYIKQKSEEL